MAEKLRNCKGCGKLFMSSGGVFCPACIEKQHQDEQRIVEYVGEHPDSTILDIVKDLEISEAIVRRLIEEGRLLQAGIDYHYPCAKCGAPIVSGQYCDSCAEQLKAAIVAERAKRDAIKPRVGMRYQNYLG
ncbi:MAG: flagellar protein [Selenomonadaceae bacterium]|nr:flagellar protein [Selenomonadaceae bacterium]